jgi:hypothetical protein
MHISRRSWFSLALFAVAAVVIVTRAGWLRHGPTQTPIPDRTLTSPLNQPGGSAPAAEAYEVYSALYQAPIDESLVFSNDSVTDIPQVNGSCLRPSTAEEHELTEAFEAANRQSHPWEEKFTIPQGYRLISRSQASEAQTCIETHGQDAARCEAYKQIRHVRFLGVPGLDRSHTRALVSVVKMCGHYCGNGGIFEVEKTGGTWRRSEPSDFTRDCSWMY